MAVILIRSFFMSATSFSISWLVVPVGWMMGGVMNGGDFIWEFIFDEVTQEDIEEEEKA